MKSLVLLLTASLVTGLTTSSNISGSVRQRSRSQTKATGKQPATTGREKGRRGEIGAPREFVPKAYSEPPQPTQEQLERLEKGIREPPNPPVVSPQRRVERVTPARPYTETRPAGELIPNPRSPRQDKMGFVGSDIKLIRTSTNEPRSVPSEVESILAVPQLAPNRLVRFLASDLFIPGAWFYPLNEPSVAQSGQNAFVVGNFYAARSTDGGASWSFLDPWAQMPDLCCDQEVIYDRGRNLFLWYQQGGDQGGGKRFLLSASVNGGTSWCSYSIGPSFINGSWTTDQRFDFPHLALSNNFLYVQTGIKGTGVPNGRDALFRLPLDMLASCSGGSVWYWLALDNWSGPVQGATTVMYFGSHLRRGDGRFRIYQQPENSTGISWKETGIPSWLLQEGDTCPSMDEQNWCNRASSVVRAGWVANGMVGFMWHARAGGSFPFPYIEAATFDAHKDLAYAGRPLIWSPDGAWQYPFVSPNARGDLGVTAYFSSTRSFPSPHFLLWDDLSPNPPPGWEAYKLRSGTESYVAWGDYTRNRVFNPSQLGWVTAVYTVRKGEAVPQFFILARERDFMSLERFWQK